MDDILAANIIQPSRSPWSFPIAVVDKKDGSKRFCTDFRKLNLICKRPSWPLPVIDAMLVVLGKSKYFTTLDLKSGYLQIPLDERDPIRSSDKEYESTKLCQGGKKLHWYVQLL